MRSLQVLGAVMGVGAIGLLAACERGQVLQALKGPPPAMGLPTPGARLVPLSPDGAGSTLALGHLGDRTLAFIADSDGHAMRVLDTRTDEELPSTELPGEPSQLVVGGDGRVFVAVRDAAEVDVLEEVGGERPSFHVTGRFSTAEEPTGLALAPDGRRLLVTCGWAHALDVFSTRTLAHEFQVDVAREPRSVVTSEDGRTAYVSHASASVVSVVDLQMPEHTVRAVRLEQPDNSGVEGKLAFRQGFALARTEFGMVVPGVTANTGDTTIRTETYGGTDATSLPAESFDVALVDEHVPGSAPEEDVTPHSVGNGSFTGCLLPRAAAYDAAGNWLFVACQGQDTVWRIDARPGGHKRSESVAWKTGGEPTGIAVDGERRAAFVWSQRARAVMSFPMDVVHTLNDGWSDGLARSVALGSVVDARNPVEVGRALFETTGDTRISSDGRACASCHPDGRDDGLVWATPDGPRQTPTLAGRLAGTAPYGWNGARTTVKQHVTNTLHRLGGSGLDGDSMDALVAYCMAMKAPPTATLRVVAAEPLVDEGRELFESAGAACSSCHMADGTFTDGERHNVQSKAKGDPKRTFDTPSLRFVAGTAPYFHDGRYPTLRELLLSSDGKMGHTAQLSPHELEALEAYLRTL